MHSDLQLLIQLQELDLAAERARRRIGEVPAAQLALDARLAERSAAVAAVKERIAANQAARRDIEKDLASVQTRLSKYKNQLMEVKTNKEYQAMQTEISVAEGHVRSHEDLLLERMEETDALSAELNAAEGQLKAEQAETVRERLALETERAALDQEMERMTVERGRLATRISAQALKLFEHVSRHRKGVALSEARDGHCSQCHVRLRPQVYNEVRRNDSLLQCESCSRILYSAAAPATGVTPQA